jgi:DNA-binding transcriptional regulator YiaG
MAQTDRGTAQVTPTEFKQHRESLNLTQQQLADLWGNDARTIRRWESGQTAIPTLAAWGIKMLTITKPALHNT